ncbi:MAG: hypothetical protein EOP65_08980 [Sphingomonas sp.]|nr:MAG: hypothetical protein EOP65_08980 [Sphingomonas sp.]
MCSRANARCGDTDGTPYRHPAYAGTHGHDVAARRAHHQPLATMGPGFRRDDGRDGVVEPTALWAPVPAR